jgi:hypothetical protein
MAKRDLAELKIPASAAFIPVAKRVASTLGGQLGLSLVDLDELSIALTQACDSAIDAANNLDGPADLKLNYFATDRALVVDVDLVPNEAHLKVDPPVPVVAVDAELQRLAYEMIRCFVDDFRPEVEPRTGHVRFRMVKYLAS